MFSRSMKPVYVAVLVAITAAALANAQVYPPARVRVADKGLAERQLLETLRNLVSQDPAQLATRVDLMIAAYSLVNYSESGDSKLEGRVAAVEKAFETYKLGGVAGNVKPTEGALNEGFRQQLEAALSDLGKRPAIQAIDSRVVMLENDVTALKMQVQELSERGGGSPKKERALAVGGMAATIASVLLLSR